MSKVVLVVHNSVGGAERMTVLIGKILHSHGFDIQFYIVNQGILTGSIVDFIPKDFSVSIIPELGPFGLITKLYHILRDERPDFVFSSALLINDKILPLIWLFPKTKFIVRCENYLYTFSKKQRIMIALLYRMADTIIAQTQEMKDELVKDSKIKAGKIVVLENPIDKQRISEGLKEEWNPYQNIGKKTIVASGRMCHQKGFDLLVEAFAKVCEKKDDVILYIIGDTSNQNEYSKVKNIALSHGISEKVNCIGFQKNPYPYVKYADCFVLSSRWEGLPNVLIESLYMGTPVAAMKCIPIIERIITDGIDGYTSDKEDVNGLAAAILKAIELGRVNTSYEGSSEEDFVNLFN